MPVFPFDWIGYVEMVLQEQSASVSFASWDEDKAKENPKKLMEAFENNV